MRPFRFQRSTIFLMLMVLASTIFAIDMGRNISQAYTGDLHFDTNWPGLFGFFVFLALILCSVAGLGYGVLCALRQSGAQRFPNIRAWTERR
jgi:hypothetical protein